MRKDGAEIVLSAAMNRLQFRINATANVFQCVSKTMYAVQ